jgi:hypothetical protein
VYNSLLSKSDYNTGTNNNNNNLYYLREKVFYIGYNGYKEYNANYMNYNKMIQMHNGMLNLFSFTPQRPTKNQNFFRNICVAIPHWL